MRELTEQRHAIMADARINAALATLQSRDLQQETGAERRRMEAELGPIRDLLAQMDKRRHD